MCDVMMHAWDAEIFVVLSLPRMRRGKKMMIKTRTNTWIERPRDGKKIAGTFWANHFLPSSAMTVEIFAFCRHLCSLVGLFGVHFVQLSSNVPMHARSMHQMHLWLLGQILLQAGAIPDASIFFSPKWGKWSPVSSDYSHYITNYVLERDMSHRARGEMMMMMMANS